MPYLLIFLALFITPISLAQSPTAPTVVEVYTSAYCPNCPAAEKQLRNKAAEDPTLLILFLHVDYWNAPGKTDPFSLAEATQRQYDYSNTLSRRPGTVYTPMPVLNGQFAAAPPLWLSWKTALKNAQTTPPSPLKISRLGQKITVTIPPSLIQKNHELTLFTTIPSTPNSTSSPTHVVTSITTAEISGPQTTLPLPPSPSGTLIVVLQAKGPGAVLGVGHIAH